MEHNDESTFDASRTSQDATRRRALGLSILLHPRGERIGEVAPLFDVGRSGQAELGRNTPVFRDDFGEACGPLGTPWVSRLPCRISAQADGSVSLSAPAGAELWLGQHRVADEVTCDADDVARGVLLRLGRYVVLRLGVFELPQEGEDGGAAVHVGGDGLGRLIGRSPQMRELREEIRRVADLEVPVMLRGETGVGKELVASALHALSPRREEPYVCVNMGAIPATMAAAELFGHSKGAFTGAGGARQGYFADADRGTLFLDEIGETALEVQPVLLRVVEHGVIQPLGGHTRAVDVRLIAATDSDLSSAVVAGRFHAALLRRFGYEIWVPPLRERVEDIPDLFLHFLREEFASFGERWRFDPARPKAKPLLPGHFVERLLRHHWPGNVRELRNVARRFAVHNRGRSEIVVDPRLLSMLALDLPRSVPVPAKPARRAQDLGEAEIVEALRKNGFEINRTAQALGVSRSWLHARMNSIAAIRKAKELDEAEIRQALREAGGDLAAAAARLEVSSRGLQLQVQRLGIAAGVYAGPTRIG